MWRISKYTFRRQRLNDPITSIIVLTNAFDQHMSCLGGGLINADVSKGGRGSSPILTAADRVTDRGVGV